MNTIILFTNRSGSTLLSDLVAYKTGNVNLGEGLHSIARDYNYNRHGNRDTQLYKDFSNYNLTGMFHNGQTMGFDHTGFHQKKQERINILKNTIVPWVAKDQTDGQTFDPNFFQYYINNNTNVLITHRRDIVSQFKSWINARYRSEIVKPGLLGLEPGRSDFIFTNNSDYYKYNTMTIPFHWLYGYTRVFVTQLMFWRCIYEMAKDKATVVSYEDHIKTNNLEHIGIGSETINNYFSQDQYLVPTPINADRVIVTNGPTGIGDVWQQALFYINTFDHLVDI